MPGFTITNDHIPRPRGRRLRVTDGRGRVWDIYVEKPRPVCGCAADHLHTPVGCLAIGCSCEATT